MPATQLQISAPTGTCLLLFGLLALTGCHGDDPASDPIDQTATPDGRVALQPVADCEVLRDALIDNWVENLLAGQRLVLEPAISTAFEDSVETLSAEADAGVASPDDVGRTNTQESGVDEADRVKADADGNIYMTQHDRLLIADAWPAATMNLLASLDLGGRASGIYLDEADDLVVALVQVHSPLPRPLDGLAAPAYIWFNPATEVVVIDVADPAAPTEIRRHRLHGNLIDSRVSQGRLHLVLGFYLDRFLGPPSPLLDELLTRYRDRYQANAFDDAEALRAEIRAELAAGAAGLDAASLLPGLATWRDDAAAYQSSLDCNRVFAPEVALRANHLLVVASMDLDGDNLRRVAALGSGWIVYASADDLFIVQPGSGWWWRPHQREQSAIHHFAIGAGAPVYVASGLAPGYPLNRFSLSYHADHLRIATTENRWGLADFSDRRSTNHLTVLRDEPGGKMSIAGAVTGFADNEQIFAARFVGERGYVVTFRRIDPLFSFDLSDPANPRIGGELELPGVSNYLHPIGDSHLLTIGRDGDAGGLSNDVAIKLFDVSDLARPREVDSYVPDLGGGYSWSDADWDPHAFTWYPPAGMLAVPIVSYAAAGGDRFAGMLALHVDLVAGLSLAGLVDHRDLLDRADCAATAAGCEDDYRYWLARPTRSLFMSRGDDTVFYSLSNVALKAVDSDDFGTTVGSLLLPSPRPYYELVYK